MDDVYKIFEYLPLRYKISVDTSYFDNLKNSVERNYNDSDFHFALTALHMIYMGIVYHHLYRLYRYSPTKFDLILIGFHSNLKKNSVGEWTWHSFSKINERSIFEFYRSVGIKKDVIGTLKKPVDHRNELVHTNGVYIDSEDLFSERAADYLRCLEKIGVFCGSILNKLFIRFLRSINVILTDEAEAVEYLENDFIPEYGVSIIQLKELVKIRQADYPTSRRNARFLQRALRKICCS